MTVLAERQERRNKLIDLKTQGLTIGDIATKLNISRRTAERDMNAVVEEIASSETPIRVFGGMLLSSRARQRKLWTMLEDTGSKPSDKILAATVLRREDEQVWKFCCEFGLFKAGTGQQEIKVSWVDRADPQNRSSTTDEYSVYSILKEHAEAQKRLKEEEQAVKSSPCNPSQATTL